MSWLDSLFGKKKESVFELPPEIVAKLTMVQNFTSADEPKLVDFPRGEYSAYWEIFIGEVPGGYVAEVRFYGYGGVGIIFAQHFIGPTLAALKQPVNELIRQRMAMYKRKAQPEVQGE